MMKIEIKKKANRKWYWVIGEAMSNLYFRKSDCKRGAERHVRAIRKPMGAKLGLMAKLVGDKPEFYNPLVVAEAKAACRHLVEVVEEVAEWSARFDNNNASLGHGKCPECGEYKTYGHAEDCELGQAIDAAKKEQK